MRIFTQLKILLIHRFHRKCQPIINLPLEFHEINLIQSPDGHKWSRYRRIKLSFMAIFDFHLHNFHTLRNTSTYDRIHRQKRPRTRNFVLKMKKSLCRRWASAHVWKFFTCVWGRMAKEEIERFSGLNENEFSVAEKWKIHSKTFNRKIIFQNDLLFLVNIYEKYFWRQ